MSATAPAPVYWGANNIPQVVAEQIISSANSSLQANGRDPVTIKREYLSDCIAEITPETQTMGAALLQITLIDPEWQISRSGMCDITADGFLPNVDVEYPPGRGVWWRLAMIDVTSDLTQANLIMTFQQRIVSYLRDCWGPLGWPAGHPGSTRAQFLQMLAAKMPSELPKSSIGPGPPPQIRFVCPDINVIQPVASSNAEATEVVTAADEQAQQAGVNKLPGVTAASKVTVRGQKPNKVQLQAINTLLGVGVGLQAPQVALVAVIYAGTWESNLTPSPPNAEGYCGVLAGSDKIFSPEDTTDEANAFFQGGKGYQAGGALTLAKSGVTNPVEIAVKVEEPSVWPTNAYANESGYPGDTAAVAEATAIVNAYNGGLGAAAPEPQSDVAQLTRGTPDNPDEDSWTCMQRLASEVNWFVFSSPQPHYGYIGDYVYYIDGPTCAAQRPSAYVELSDDGTTWSMTDPDTGKVFTGGGPGCLTSLTMTVDNTAFQYMQTRQVKGRTQRQTRIRTPQTPSQILMNAIVGVMQFNAGDVFVFHNAGPLDGRWIVEDVTQNSLADLFAQFTLGPPTLPYPEPQAGTATVLGPDGQPVTVSTGQSPGFQNPGQSTPAGSGSAAAGATVAQQCVVREKALHCFHYSQVRPIQYDIETGNPVYIDCSGFAIACYKAAGLHDPSDNNYDGSGYTGSMITHCTRVSLGDATPGDLVFYGPPPCLHVTVYIGNGQVVSMGQEGDPSQGSWDLMGPCPPYGIFRSNYASTSTGPASPAPPARTYIPQEKSIAPPDSPPPYQPLSGIFKSIWQ